MHPHLIEHMAAHPRSRDWWLDIASDRYHLDEYNSALEALNEHHGSSPDTRVTERHLVRGRYRVSPYGRDSLELSGITLGVPPSEGERAHIRHEEELVPRPSLRFKLDEIIRLYLEIYGLVPDSNGERSYLQAVTVRQAGGEDGKKKSRLSQIFGWGGKRKSSMTINFSGQFTGNGPFPAGVDIDTSLLIPGSYKLLVTIKDRHSGQVRTVDREFELLE